MTEQHEQRQTRPEPHDSGFTLTEVLIVMAMIGLLLGTLAAVFTVIVRTTPSAEDRVNDARSIQGLVTWLPQDIDATPPDGFDRVAGFWPCAGSAPAGSNNVLSMEWSENTTSVTSYAASYRFEMVGSEPVMARYTCEPLGTPTRIGLTSGLSATAPSVEMCAVQLNATTGACDTVIPPADTTTEVLAVKLEVTHPDGDQSTIDAASKNPDQELADDPDAITKFPPQVGNALSFPTTMTEGDTQIFDLLAPGTHEVFDVDSDVFTELSVVADPYQPLPTGLTVSTAAPLDVTIVAGAYVPWAGSATPQSVHLIVSDEVGLYINVTIEVTVNDAPNLDPVVGSGYHLTLEPGETVILPVDLSNDVTDPNEDPMSLTLVSYPPLLAPAPIVGGSLGPMEMEVSAPAAATPWVFVAPIELRVEDGFGGWATAFVTVEYVAAGSNSAPSAAADVPVTMFAGDTATVTVTDPATAGHGLVDPDGDLVLVSIDGAAAAPADITTTIDGFDVVIEAGTWIADGPASAPIALIFQDIHGASVTATVTVTIATAPPPPSNCVLKTLTTSHPAGVNRTGAGSFRLLEQTVTVTLDYEGTCNGLTLYYDSGHVSGRGDPAGVNFPTGGSPTFINILSDADSGDERFVDGTIVLTATAADTAPATPTFITTDLIVNP